MVLRAKNRTSVAVSAWKEPWIKDLAAHIIDHLQSNSEWMGLSKTPDHEIRLLDYACGNGVASMALAPYVTYIRGIDISAGMVEQFGITAKNSGFTPEHMHAVQGNLLDSSDALSGPELQGFDIGVMCMALHHVEDTNQMIARLVERLKKGGLLLIIEWESKTPAERNDSDHHHHQYHQSHGYQHRQVPGPHHGHDHDHTLGAGTPAERTVAHRHGFGEKDMHDMFSRVGLRDIGFRAAAETFTAPPNMGGTRRLFVAKGRKV